MLLNRRSQLTEPHQERLGSDGKITPQLPAKNMRGYFFAF